jgi:hypothetical protein
MSRQYTMTPSALAARRKGAAAMAARARTEWRTIRLHRAAVEAIRSAARARSETASAVVLTDVRKGE